MNSVGPPYELVSVVIPTFRRPVEVRAAVLSVLEQTWPELEVLVVSDGPDPVTREALADLDGRLRYLELAKNQGPAAARNAGVAASKGAWLAFLDDDDLMLPERIQRQMELADADRPHQMISCRTWYRHEGRSDLWPKEAMRADQDLADYMLLRPSLLGRPGVLSIQSLLVHRSIVERVPFTSYPDHEDWAWLLEAWYGCSARVSFAWQPLVIYNIDTSSMSRSRRMNWEDSLRWAQHHRRYIRDRAYCSFLATKVALKAKRAGDWTGLREISGEILRNGPGWLELVFLAGVLLLPSVVIQGAWKRSLHAGEMQQNEAVTA